VRAAGRLAPNVDRPLPSPAATFASPRFRLHSGGDIQGPNQIFQSVRRHGHSNGEKNKRGDDHSDSNCSEPTSEPAFGFFRMSDRDILDQGSDHVATGSQHHPDSKAHEGSFESRIASGYASGLVGDGEIAEKR
jgi:hypothetical protein